MRSILPMLLLTLVACDANRPDAATSALLSKYDSIGALAAFCEWKSNPMVGPRTKLKGSFVLGDEHIPDFFTPESSDQLPLGARNSLLVVTFKKGLSAQWPVIDNPAIVSGRIAVGLLRCVGNFSSEDFSAALLIDDVAAQTQKTRPNH